MAAPPVRTAQPQRARKDGAGFFDDDDERSGDPVEDEQRGGDDGREAVGRLNGDILGDNFTQHDVKKTHQEERQDEAESMHKFRRGWSEDRLKRGDKSVVKSPFAGPTQAE